MTLDWQNSLAAWIVAKVVHCGLQQLELPAVGAATHLVGASWVFHGNFFCIFIKSDGFMTIYISNLNWFLSGTQILVILGVATLQLQQSDPSAAAPSGFAGAAVAPATTAGDQLTVTAAKPQVELSDGPSMFRLIL